MFRLGIILLVSLVLLFVLGGLGALVFDRHVNQPSSPYVAGHDFSEEQKLSDLIPEIGKPLQIVWNGLSSFKETTGHYPETLKQLEDDFIEEIPKPLWGAGEWRYKYFPEEDTFALVLKERDSSYVGLYITADENEEIAWTWDH